MKSFFLTLVTVLFMGQTATALCALSAEVEDTLTRNYGEVPVRRGIQSQISLLEWWENPSTGSFTILRRTADGRLCVVAEGQASHEPAQTPDGEDM